MDLRKEDLPKIAQDTALAGARISIGLAGLCLAILSISVIPDTRGEQYVVLPVFVRTMLLILGVASVYSAAIMIDWIVDNFSTEVWISLRGSVEGLDRHDQFHTRLELFNHGYFLLSLCLGGVVVAILSQGSSLVAPNTYSLNPIVQYLVSVLAGMYIVYQMMTYESGKFIFALGAFLISVGVIVGAVFV